MKRDEATRRIVGLIERVIAGGNVYLDAVEEISLFGSYVSGALNPGDVDMLVRNSDPTGAIHAEEMRRLWAHQSTTVPFEQALRGRQRGMNILFNQGDHLERQGGFDVRLLWQRGESIALAHERLARIAPDPAAGSAPRDFPHPALKGFEKRTVLEDRQHLVELEANNALHVLRLEIDRGAEPQNEALRRHAGSGYSETSPRRKCMIAVLASLEARGVPVTESSGGLILQRGDDNPRYAVVEHGSFRLGAAIDDALWRTGRSFCVLNLTGREPIQLLEITAAAWPPPEAGYAA